MGVDISALGSLSLQATALSNLILVNPQKNVGMQPQLPSGTTGANESKSYLFDIEGENVSTLDIDITDHFAEDNTALQDQSAIKPLLVDTEGFIAELNDVVPAALVPLKTATEKLSTVSSFVPGLSATALIAYNDAILAYNVAKLATSAAISAWGSVTGASPVQNKQQQFYQLFTAYAKSRQLFTVQTPWAVHTDMQIKSLRAVQDAETGVITTFNVTFKERRFASSIGSLGTGAISQGRAIDQSSDIIDHGVSVPVPGPSVATQLSTSGLA